MSSNTTIVKAINNLAKSTELSYTSAPEVRRAFLLGLWYRSFPDYMFENLSRGHNWDLEHIDPANYSNYNFDTVYPNLFKFQFIADTGDSWHQCYRDLRERGWNRLKVWREGGRLQYLMRAVRVDMPQGYSMLTLLLDISISTCRQVQVGTRTIEQPIYETKCDDLVDLNDAEVEPPPAYAESFLKEGSELAPRPMNPEIQSDASAEIVPLTVIDDIEELQRRRDSLTDAAARDNQRTHHDNPDSIPF